MLGIYLINLSGAFLLSSLAEHGAIYDENNKKKINSFFILLIIFFVVILGFRYLNYLHSDEWAYRQSTEENFSLLLILRPEGLSYFLQWFSCNVANHLGGVFAYGQFYILSTSIIIVVLFLKSMWDYSRNFTFSVFLFVSMWFAFTSMNIIRQFVAVSIIFYGLRFVKKEEFKKFFICVILAVGFHTSALIMLPLYFIIKSKKTSDWAVILIAASFLLIGNIGDLSEVLLGDTKYTSFINSTSYGVNPLRILSMAIPAIAILLFKNKVIEMNKDCLVESNLMIFLLITCIFSFQNVYINRIIYYFSIGALIVFPEIPNLLDVKYKSVIKLIMIILFFLFGMHQANISVEYHNFLFENVIGVL